MTIVLNGTTGITNDGGYTGDGVVFADTTPANTLVTTTGGNVGIGTSSPTQRLQVNGPTVTQSLYNTNAVANDDSAASIKATNGPLWNYLNFDASSYRFNTYGAERARIDSSGNVGIGTSSPTAKLEVHSNASTGRVLLNGADLPMITNGYDKFTSGAYNGAGRWGLFMEVNTIAAGFPNDSNKGFKVLRLNPDSSSSTAFQVGFNNGGKHYAATNGFWNNMTLLLQDDSAGAAQPGIGFHAPANTTATILKMYGPTGNFECRNASDSGFVAILASAFNPSSDYRIKTDVAEVGSVLSNVLALRPVNYEKDGITGREYGLIAHEAAELFPDLVQGEKDGMRPDGTMELQTVSYAGLTSVLVKAIQEQQAIITALTARVAALEGK